MFFVCLFFVFCLFVFVCLFFLSLFRAVLFRFVVVVVVVLMLVLPDSPDYTLLTGNKLTVQEAKLNSCSPEDFPKQIFRRAVVAIPRIINTERHITLHLLPVHRYGYPFSIDTKTSTN